MIEAGRRGYRVCLCIVDPFYVDPMSHMKHHGVSEASRRVWELSLRRWTLLSCYSGVIVHRVASPRDVKWLSGAPPEPEPEPVACYYSELQGLAPCRCWNLVDLGKSGVSFMWMSTAHSARARQSGFYPDS
ncbi:hypothetical protein Nepgr_033948 [Nepenthes gracilis]|uniref:Uncharacterized protein n=1 Tax=Nepenthes gracilis TaxID=150966 RepID=A0AAD3TMW0_NEPGR|nr:hypothetical protein Nepgr_033948 [Nepenthes gracilis]